MLRRYPGDIAERHPEKLMRSIRFFARHDHGGRRGPGLVKEFVPASFDPPLGLDHAAFRLRPLGPEHNDSDHAAWTSSLDHIRSTPGFTGDGWPHPMTLEENLADLVRHAGDFAARRGFTYTVLAPGKDRATVIGCVYIYPSERAGYDARVRSWVRAAAAGLDAHLYLAVADWLDAAWPFERVDYAIRPDAAPPTPAA